MKYKVALVGCGWAAVGSQLDELRVKPACHAEAVSMCEKTELSAFLDLDDEALKLAQKLYPGVPAYKDIHKMLAEVKPDIAIIATHPDSHCEYIETCSNAGVKAVLSEKPISHESKLAKKAIETCQKNKTLLQVNHQRRFDPLLRRFREYISGGYVQDTFIGKIRSGTAYYDKGLFHCGTHLIDLLTYFLGPVRWVSAQKNEIFQAEHDDIGVDGILGFDGLNLALQFFNTREYALAEVSLFGERGRINLKHMWGMEIELIGTAPCQDFSAYKELDYERTRVFKERRSWFGAYLEQMIACLEGKDVPISTGEDALRTLEIMQALVKSAESNGQRVNL